MANIKNNMNSTVHVVAVEDRTFGDGENEGSTSFNKGTRQTALHEAITSKRKRKYRF